eukprot:TRINITY_DN1619_c0_g1_i1.p1 TRINITY_DN1619_c0_g1~~TRINITY_DN1619_c0_g1_i1.p1  ORF type:complete len:762 (+),score=191.69 TRINITY_DN1619_c0_g1_i1:66-2351(+)
MKLAAIVQASRPTTAAAADGGFRLEVAVKDSRFTQQCGAGEQLVRWLAFAAAKTYCVAATLQPDQLPPAYVLTAAKKPVDPYARLCDVLANGSSVRVVLEEEADLIRELALDAAQLAPPPPMPTASCGDAPALAEASALPRTPPPETPHDDYSSDTDGEASKASLTRPPRPPRFNVQHPYDFDDQGLFMRSLAKIMTNPDLSAYVGWSSSGHSLVIYDKDRFSRDVMPKYLPYSNIDLLYRNLHRCAFLPSYPPIYEANDLKYSEDQRLEFVHPFGFVPPSPGTREAGLQLAAKQMREFARRIKSRAADKLRPLTDADRGQLLDRQLQALLSEFNAADSFSAFFRKQLGLQRLLPVPGHEELVMIQRCFQEHLPYIVAAFRYGCYSIADVCGFLSLLEFSSVMRFLLGETPTVTHELDLAFIQANVHHPGDRDEMAVDTARQMVLHEFMSSIVRVAAVKYGGGPAVAKSFQAMLTANLIPAIQKVLDDDFTAIFRLNGLFSNVELQATFDRHSARLRSTFASAVSPETRMSYERFRLLLTQLRIVDTDNATVTAAKRAFVLVGALETADGNSAVLTADQFTHALFLFFCILQYQQVDASATAPAAPVAVTPAPAPAPVTPASPSQTPARASSKVNRAGRSTSFNMQPTTLNAAGSRAGTGRSGTGSRTPTTAAPAPAPAPPAPAPAPAPAAPALLEPAAPRFFGHDFLAPEDHALLIQLFNDFVGGSVHEIQLHPPNPKKKRAPVLTPQQAGKQAARPARK